VSPNARKITVNTWHDVQKVRPVVELSESFQGGLMAIAERQPIMGGLGQSLKYGGQAPRNSSTGFGYLYSIAVM